LNYSISYKLSVQDSIQKIANELIKESISECRSKQLTNDDIIHSVRKKCKRIRGLLRIVRPNIGNLYRNENQFYRDLAHNLSDARDRRVIIETLEKLGSLTKNKSHFDMFQDIIQKKEESNRLFNISKLVKEFELTIADSLKGIKNWQLEEKKFNSLKGGLGKTYRRGKNAMINTFQNPTTENYHEWRKRVKYHYFHLEFLIPVWENIISEHCNEVHRLSEMLGYDHDLCILKELINSDPKLIENSRARRIISDTIDVEQIDLRIKIKLLGKKVFAEKARQLLKRLEQYWDVWEKEYTYTVYMMTNDESTIFTGLTNNLAKKIVEIRTGINPRCFASRLKLTKLVYYESFLDRMTAVIKVKQIKRMAREKKLSLVRKTNPDFLDLFNSMKN